MPPASYSFLDVVILDDVRERFASGDALVILSEDLEDIIWANGPGALLFGNGAIDEIIGAPSGLGPITKRQIKATSGFPAISRDRPVLARMANGNAQMFLASAVVLPDGEQGILLASPASAGNADKLSAARALAGFSDSGQYVAFVDAEGAIEAASPGFSRLGLSPEIIAGLIGRLGGGESRIVKRMLAGTRGLFPAGLAWLTEKPARYLLVVIDETPAQDAPLAADDATLSASGGIDSSTVERAATSAEEAPTSSLADPVTVAQSDMAGDDIADPPTLDDAGIPIDPPPVLLDEAPGSEIGLVEADHDSWYFNAQGPEARAASPTGDETPIEQPPVRDTGSAIETMVAGENAEAASLETMPGEPAATEDVAQPDFQDAPPTDDEVAEAIVVEAAEANVDDAPAVLEATAADNVLEVDEPERSEIVQPDSPEAEERPALASAERSTLPVRFVWRTDADGKFSQVSPEFAGAVGSEAADIVGRRFEDVALAFGLDPSDEIAGLLARRDTWSGRSVFWPVAGTDLKIPVDLAALPVYGRSRVFEGFRGFGVARCGDAVADDERLGLALVPGNAAGKPARDMEDEQAAKAELPAAADAQPADPFQGEVPALAIAPMPDRRFADKVIRLAEHRPAANDKSLTSGERIAFQQIGERLKKDAIDPPRASVADSTTEPLVRAEDAAGELPEESPASAQAIDATSPVAAPTPSGDETSAPDALADVDATVGQTAAMQPETASAMEQQGADEAAIGGAAGEFAGSVLADETPAMNDVGSASRSDTPSAPEPNFGDPEEQVEQFEAATGAWTGEASLTEAEAGEDKADITVAGQETDVPPDGGKAAPAMDFRPTQKTPRSALSLIDFSGWRNDNEPSEKGVALEADASPLTDMSEEKRETENAEPTGQSGDGDETEPAQVSDETLGETQPDTPDDRLLAETDVEEAAEIDARPAEALSEATEPVTEIVADLSPEQTVSADAPTAVEGKSTSVAADELPDNPPIETEPVINAASTIDAVDEPGRAAPPEDETGIPAQPVAQTAVEGLSGDIGGGDRTAQVEQPPADEAVSADSFAAMPAASQDDPLPAAVETPHPAPQTGGDTTILEKLPVPVLVHSGDILHYANAEFLALTGYGSVDDLADAGGIGALFAAPYEESGEDRADRQLRLRQRDGEEFPVEAFLRSVPWGDGKALLLVLSRAKEGAFAGGATQSPLIAELEARVAEMRTIIDTATDGVVLIARDGTVRSISRPAEALFGFDSDDVAGKPFASLFAIESQRAARDYLNGLSDNGVASVLNDGREVIGREAQGRFIPLFMTIGRLPSDSGFCAVVRDITQWKRAEEELTQARSVAERASSHKTDFLARVSHEIRTPLNAIIGFSELMIDEKFGPVTNDRYRDYLRDINRSGNHVLDLVNDLLDISKIEAGQQDMAYEAVSLNDTLAETVAMMQPQANRERVIIRSSFASKLPDVVADLRSVRQIALNILSNAVRYTQAGGQVIVSTAYESTGDVAMRVRDTGIGMTQAEIEQALKPFKQINSLKRARGDGTGLGLPLTKAMVEANRAKFVIHSTPGEGTLVEITFPSTRVLAD